MPLFTLHYTSLEKLWKTWVLFNSVWYHHRKSFTWLLSLKFVTQESPRRIFKPENELPNRIITISPNIHHRHRSGKCSRSFSKQRTNSRQARAPQWACRAPLWAWPTLRWGCKPAPQPRPTPSRAFIQVTILVGTQIYLGLVLPNAAKATQHDQYSFQLLNWLFKHLYNVWITTNAFFSLPVS